MTPYEQNLANRARLRPIVCRLNQRGVLDQDGDSVMEARVAIERLTPIARQPHPSDQVSELPLPLEIA